MYDNNLSGPIPPNLSLRSLSFLDLGRNNFNGTIPSDWWIGDRSLLFDLRHLHLDENQFSGELPAEFATIGNGRLNQLTVAHNRFTGIVPSDFNLQLVAVEVQGNMFTEFGKDLCKLSVFHSGEIVSLRSDCSICECGAPFCVQPLCTP